MRVFPLSNWTELDVWQYIKRESIPIVPLYLAAPPPDGRARWNVDHGGRRSHAARCPEKFPSMRCVRFRTLGCYPLTGAIESTASTLSEVIQEMLLTTTSERQGRLIDTDSSGSMEKKKHEGYF